MPSFFWKELRTTFSLEEQAQMRKDLEEQGVDCRVKAVNRDSPSSFAAGTRSRHGTLGENQQLACQYILQVRPEDWEQADFLLRQRERNASSQDCLKNNPSGKAAVGQFFLRDCGFTEGEIFQYWIKTEVFSKEERQKIKKPTNTVDISPKRLYNSILYQNG